MLLGTSNRIAYLNDTANDIDNIPFGDVDKCDLNGRVSRVYMSVYLYTDVIV
jgi:hypothetical protein